MDQTEIGGGRMGDAAAAPRKRNWAGFSLPGNSTVFVLCVCVCVCVCVVLPRCSSTSRG